MNAAPTTEPRKALHIEACAAIYDARLGGPSPVQWSLCRAAARALTLDRAWRRVRALLQEAPEGALVQFWAAVSPGEVLPHRRYLLEACRYRLTANERAAAAATSPATLPAWPEDAHALETLRRCRVEHHYVSALIAGVQGLWRMRAIQRQEAQAPNRMQALRRRKVRS